MNTELLEFIIMNLNHFSEFKAIKVIDPNRDARVLDSRRLHRVFPILGVNPAEDLL